MPWVRGSSSPEVVETVQPMSMYLTIVASLSVALVLGLGLWNLARRNSSPSLSQTLMRWRVGLQFVAVAVAMLTVYLVR